MIENHWIIHFLGAGDAIWRGISQIIENMASGRSVEVVDTEHCAHNLLPFLNPTLCGLSIAAQSRVAQWYTGGRTTWDQQATFSVHVKCEWTTCWLKHAWFRIAERRAHSQLDESLVAVLGHCKSHVCFCVFRSLGEDKCGSAVDLPFFFSNASRVSAVSRGWPLWFNTSHSFVFERVAAGYVERMCVLELNNCVF